MSYRGGVGEFWNLENGPRTYSYGLRNTRENAHLSSWHRGKYSFIAPFPINAGKMVSEMFPADREHT